MKYLTLFFLFIFLGSTLLAQHSQLFKGYYVNNESDSIILNRIEISAAYIFGIKY
jgi:hypothetical protein